MEVLATELVKLSPDPLALVDMPKDLGPFTP
jgi:hypothetical protein